MDNMPWKRDLQNTVEWLEQMRDAKSTTEIGEILHRSITPLGAKHVFIGILPRAGIGPRDQRKHLLLTDFPKNWIDHYLKMNLVADDPVAKALASGVSPVRWLDLAQDTSISKKERLVMSGAAEHGLRDGLSISVPIFTDRCIAFSVSGEHIEVPSMQCRQLHMIATLATARLLTLKTAPISLSSRELQALDLRSKGALVSEIAGKMHLSRNGVNYLLHGVKAKLGVSHLAEAIRICAQIGLLQ